MIEKAKQAIEKTEDFFNSLDIKTRLSEYTDDYKDSGKFIEDSFTKRGLTGIGEHRSLKPSDARKIVEMSY